MPKPSLIVVPAVIYFIAMMILAGVQAPFINDGVAGFCFQLQNASSRINESCSTLFNDYSSGYQGEGEERYTALSPAWNYWLTIVFCWSTLAAFITCFMIMMLRCLFVVDFELVKIVLDKEDGPLLIKSLQSESEGKY